MFLTRRGVFVIIKSHGQFREVFRSARKISLFLALGRGKKISLQTLGMSSFGPEVARKGKGHEKNSVGGIWVLVGVISMRIGGLPG